jgi:hypothetical protein
VDASRFDEMVKRVATVRLTRVRALQGLAAAGIAAATGVTLFAEETGAKKKNRKAKKKSVCQCTAASLESCSNRKVKKKQRKQVFRASPCSYQGSCRNFNPCSPFPTSGATPGGGATITNNTIVQPGQTVTPTGPGNTCVLGTAQGCPGNFTCVLNAAGVQVCLPNNLVLNCTTNAQCPSGFCRNIAGGLGICLPCGVLGTTLCGSGASQECCVLGVCSNILNICLLPQGGGLLGLG